MIRRKRRVKRLFRIFNFQSESWFYFFSALDTSKALKMSWPAVGNGVLWLTPCKLACERSLEIRPDIAVSVGDGRSW